MLNTYLDVTEEFNAANGVVIDTSGWDYSVWQFVAPTGTISITATNDGGDLQGTRDGSPTNATNFVTVSATRLSDNTLVTAVAAAGLFKLTGLGRYVRFAGASAAATKVIVQLSQIN
jgi:hypothetical protein